MGKVVLRYIVKHRTKGRDYFYFRHGKRYVPMPAPDDPAFSVAYKKQLDRIRADLPSAPAVAGSFAELTEKYLGSTEYKSLAATTSKEYRRHLDRLKGLWGDLPVKRLTRSAVMDYRDSLQATPRKASYAMQVLRRLLSFGVDRGMLASNPALRPGITGPKNEHQPWSDADIKTFREANAGNTLALRTLMLGICTGQRRGDLVKMTRHDYDGRAIAIYQNKTREKVWIPAHVSLRQELETLDGFMLLQSERGKAFTARHLSNIFLDAIRHANLNGLTLHGLRVTAATWLAEAGCTEAEIQTILGHRTVAMAAKYRRNHDKRVSAHSAIAKLERSRVKV